MFSPMSIFLIPLHSRKLYQGEIQTHHVQILKIKITSSIHSDTDVIIGGLDDHIFASEYFVATFPYYNDELTWCVQKSKPIPLWKNIFKLINDRSYWTILTLACILVISLIYFMQTFDQVKPKWDVIRIIFCGLRIYCGFVCEYKPKINSTRILFTSLLLAFILFDVTFVTFWSEYMKTTHFEDQINTVKGIIDNEFEIVGDVFALHHLKHQNEVNSFRRNSKNILF